ncbi:diguanylate cyclase [Paraburkholderia phymatum]|uniref:Diguanylate cyclase with PAS/PAC sensor n=1 Tax=Paraburkholderia phymatum (strain DSM 17167 / CIP 108236 / LMG 21445 / STM815) TaxID=391038 RepID=B2JWW6_PARP8|nr:sensor domain-containing diguanylate cyclase [Paraburkholderia phymatum]ACC75443.1 diguanylate cyclase with PAS/PAC sensor [Paraburkholderia phymatum STM815]
MSEKASIFASLLATPTPGKAVVSPSVRAALLSALFDNAWPLFLSGISSVFVAIVACVRLHQTWAVLWLIADMAVLATRLGIVRTYVARSRVCAVHPGPWAARYAPVGLCACLLLGLGTAACFLSPDKELATLSIMVAAGILGGIASRNAALPRLAIAQILLGTMPIGIGALLAPQSGAWILVPPLIAYNAAMVSVVRRHYQGLVALMTAEQRHAELAARFDAALAHMPHGLCTVDGAGNVVIANRRTAELFGATVERLKLNVPLPEFIGHVGIAQFGETLHKRLVEQCNAWLGDGHGPLDPMDLELEDGRQLELTRNPVPDGSAVIIIEDVTQRRQTEAKILHLASHDSLTGLPNRRELRDRLEQILSVRARPQGGSVAMMYLDLDGFKQVNDRLGHCAGDEVLETVAARLSRVLRPGELVARLGGDEFAIIADHTTLPSVVALAQRVIRDIALPYHLSTGEAVSIGTSVGIALAANDDSVDGLIRRADQALYSAKQAGRGTYRVANA